MSAGPRELIQRWFQEVWNEGREESIDEMFAPDAVGFGLGETDRTVISPGEFKVFWRNLRTAIPNLHISIQDTIVDGDKAVVRVILKGTHSGAGLGASPSGNAVNIAGIVIAQFAGGQIVKAWNSWDQLGLLRQMNAPAGVASKDRFLAAGR